MKKADNDIIGVIRLKRSDDKKQSQDNQQAKRTNPLRFLHHPNDINSTPVNIKHQPPNYKTIHLDTRPNKKEKLYNKVNRTESFVHKCYKKRPMT